MILVNLNGKGKVGVGIEIKLNKTWALLCKAWREKSHSSVCIRIFTLNVVSDEVLTSSIPSAVPATLGNYIFLNE